MLARVTSLRFIIELVLRDVQSNRCHGMLPGFVRGASGFGGYGFRVRDGGGGDSWNIIIWYRNNICR